MFFWVRLSQANALFSMGTIKCCNAFNFADTSIRLTGELISSVKVYALYWLNLVTFNNEQT